MNDEIRVAAKWWGDQLRGVAKQDNGDFMQSAFATYVTSLQRPLPEEQIARFESELVRLCSEKFAGHWFPEDPSRGNYFRCLNCDYGPGGLLADACEAAGLNPSRQHLRFPCKTSMWIDPGRVMVSCGYGADPVALMGAPEFKEEPAP